MEYNRNSTAICLGDAKKAALFFDRVFPLNIEDLISGAGLRRSRENLTKEKMADYLYEIITIMDSLNNYDSENIDTKIERTFEYVRALKLLYSETKYYFDKYILNLQKYSFDIEETITELMKLPHETFETISCMAKIFDRKKINVEKMDFDAITKVIAESQMEFIGLAYVNNVKFSGGRGIKDIINSFSSSLSVKGIPLLVPSACLRFQNPMEEDITISLANLPIIDTARTDWDQIIELRKDDNARRKLRNLRLFMHEKYEGKSLSFLEDDIGKRLDEYDSVCREYGFSTITSTLSAVLNSKSLQTTIVASVGAALLGNPLLLAGTILTGAAIEIGKIVLEIANKKHAFHKIKNSHELAYIIDVKKRLE